MSQRAANCTYSEQSSPVNTHPFPGRKQASVRASRLAPPSSPSVTSARCLFRSRFTRVPTEVAAREQIRPNPNSPSVTCVRCLFRLRSTRVETVVAARAIWPKPPDRITFRRYLNERRQSSIHRQTFEDSSSYCPPPFAWNWGK